MVSLLETCHPQVERYPSALFSYYKIAQRRLNVACRHQSIDDLDHVPLSMRIKLLKIMYKYK